MKSEEALSSLLPGADADILEYLSATVDEAVESGESLVEVLSDLLVSYELAEDETQAAALCEKLVALVSAGGAAPKEALLPPLPDLLSAPIKMADFEDDLVSTAAGFGAGMGACTDAFGNSCSFAARANASAAAKATIVNAKARTRDADDADDDDDEGEEGEEGAEAEGAVPEGFGLHSHHL